MTPVYRGTVTMPNGAMLTEHGRTDVYTVAIGHDSYSVKVTEYPTFDEAASATGYTPDQVRAAQAVCVYCTRAA